LLIWAASASAQTIEEDPLITQMVNSYVEFNHTHQQVRGWRVQVLVTTDRRQMERARSRFESLWPEFKLLFSHEIPFYHLKSGAFLNRQSARPFLRKLQKDFPSAFLVADEIDVAEVLIYQ